MSESTDSLVQRLHAACAAAGPVRVMEICGTHTVSLFRSGVKSLLPESLRLISGPGCPVCVTPQGYIDACCDLAARPGVTIATYGDMVRVPGSTSSLERRRAEGADILVIYSARDAVRYAAEHPDRQVVFLAVGFETTAPATAAAILEAESLSLTNFTALSGHKLVIPAMSALLSAGDVPIDGFLCPGHVSVVIGVEAYRPIVEQFHRPCVVAGFEPGNMLAGLLNLVEQIGRHEAHLDNVYAVAVNPRGNTAAMAAIDRVFEPGDTLWRAMGTIPASGLVIRPAYAQFDAARRFELAMDEDHDLPGCRCGEVIQGKVEPAECSLFGNACTPTAPVGPCMVSSEGTCAAWYKYGRAGTRRVPRPASAGGPRA